MASELLSIVGVNGDTLKGRCWKINNPKGVVFIVTGMEEHISRYDAFATYLNANGYSVYSLDHYGQGENVDDLSKLGIVPRSAFSKYVRTLHDLMKKYSIKGKKTIILGHSMGSFYVQDFIQRYSKQADKAIIMGSNGKNAKGLYSFGYQLARFVSKLSGENKKGKLMAGLSFNSYKKSVKNRKTDFDWLSTNEENVKNYIDDPKCGYGSANCFYREMLKGNHRLYKNKFLSKISPDLEILVTSGDADPVGAMGKGPRCLKKMYKELGVKNVELNLYKGMRHEILNEVNNEVVYQDILRFIEK